MDTDTQIQIENKDGIKRQGHIALACTWRHSKTMQVLQKLYLLRYKQQSHVARKLGLNLSITDIKTAD